MSISFVYHHHERAEPETLSESLAARGCEVNLAPLGMPVGSEGWVQRVKADIESSIMCEVFLTEKSVLDEWVGQRCEWAIVKGISIVPIQKHIQLPPYKDWKIPVAEMIMRQCLVLEDAVLDRLADRVANAYFDRLPKSCFVSYSRNDQTFVNKMQQRLQDAGLMVWRDVTDISAGRTWDTEIEKAIARCTSIIFVATRNSIASQNVADELGYARNLHKQIIPVLLEDVTLPLRIHRAQGVDFRGDFDEACAKLIEAVFNQGNNR